MSTGQIFFLAGAAGLIGSIIATVVSMIAMRRKKKKLNTEIWNEYR